ncbi:MAG: amino acid ABC transporter ATPase [Candidatus Entotheonella gemina]|uniref:Amino acid ABC transporter ATPase n=1 Tax=Candidatus Entotheonella gemina TaxID=1429439 RepID=W4LXC7_9BACT|nr:MAG: amino acid ABC transporter ATPase [Candidatus Entotheonella gemina]
MLTINNVETYYGNIRALKGVSLTVPEGSTVTLLGANGAGKSTTLKTISGLVPAASGTIEFMNQRIDRLAPERIVRLGISHVPEGREVFKELTVAENLKMGAYTRRDKREIEASYESIYSLYPVLKERRLQLAGTLSGGEQQMLAIGRALMGRPKLLLLAEPSLGLAPKLVEEIFSVIQRINQEGITVLLVEQNANKALGIAEYGYVLETGSIALEDKAGSLLENDHVRRSYLGE